MENLLEKYKSASDSTERSLEHVTVRIPHEVLENLDDLNQNRSEAIREALKGYYDM